MTTTGTHSRPTPGAAAPDSAAPGTQADGALDSQIDSLLSDTPGQDQPASASQQAEDAVASIEKQVESLVDQFVEHEAAEATPESAAQPAPQPVPSPEPVSETPPSIETRTPPSAESIGELDDQLARLTDELLLTPPPEAPAASTPVYAPEPVAPAPAPEPMPAAVAPTAPVAMDSPEPVSSGPSPASVPTPAQPGKLVRLFAKPLAGKSRIVRDTAGWLGFNTVFLAGVVWCYHLWFQKPEKPTPQHAPAALVASDHDAHNDVPQESRQDAHGQPAAHGEEAGSHADGSEHTDDPADHPVTGVAPLHKKKPTYALSAAMAEKLNVAKKSDGGHGSGGHGAEKKSGSGHGAPAKSGH